MKNLRRIFGLLVVLVITGCASERVKTRVISEPPGARIEVNGAYVGTAPVEVTLPQSASSHKLKGRVMVLAFPVAADQKVQQKVLRHRQVAPQEIYFDMRLERILESTEEPVPTQPAPDTPNQTPPPSEPPPPPPVP